MAVLFLSLLIAGEASDSPPGHPDIWLKADPKFAAAELRIARLDLQRIDPGDVSKLPQRRLVAIERIPKIRRLGWCVPYLRDFRRGNVGRIRGFFIQQILGERKAVVQVRYDGYNLREKNVLLSGYDFGGLTDDEHVSVDIPIEVIGPESFWTGLGTKRTVHAVRVVDEDSCWAAAERAFSEKEQRLFREYLMLKGRKDLANSELAADVAGQDGNSSRDQTVSPIPPRPADARLSSGERLGEVVHWMMEARSAVRDFQGPPSVKARLVSRCRELSSRLALEPEWIRLFGERRSPWTVPDRELVKKVVEPAPSKVSPAHATDAIDNDEIARRLVAAAKRLRNAGSNKAADVLLNSAIKKYGATKAAAEARRMLK